MKHLPKHLRPNWRYVAVDLEADPDVALERGAFQRDCWYAAQNLLGDATSADLDATVVRFAARDGRAQAIVRTRRDTVESLRAALACLARVDDEPVGVTIRGVSGTIRACEERYVDDDAVRASERTVSIDGRETRAVLRGDSVTIGDDAVGWRYGTPSDLDEVPPEGE
jgi:ribonuclease P/MRP protein subunit POP5